MKMHGVVLLAILGAGPATGALAAPANITAAVADPNRPDADRQRDANRKPAEALAFAGVAVGARVADFIPGTGYYSRILATAVGPNGHVYGFFPSELSHFIKTPLPPNGVAPYPAYPNVTALVAPVNQFAPPEPLDLVWISDNYHDLHDPFFAPADLAVINKAVFAALKPGGTYVVLDHAAPNGSGLADTNTLHRIDEASVKSEVEAAGFVYDGESDALRNPADTRDKSIFDPSVKGKTDQFILKFHKPAR
jgi:predicted methyltransferase